MSFGGGVWAVGTVIGAAISMVCWYPWSTNHHSVLSLQIKTQLTGITLTWRNISVIRTTKTNMEEKGLMIYTATSHKGATRMGWLHFFGAVMSTIRSIYILHSLSWDCLVLMTDTLKVPRSLRLWRCDSRPGLYLVHFLSNTFSSPLFHYTRWVGYMCQIIIIIKSCLTNWWKNQINLDELKLFEDPGSWRELMVYGLLQLKSLVDQTGWCYALLSGTPAEAEAELVPQSNTCRHSRSSWCLYSQLIMNQAEKIL